jgi:hypothetical protein
MPFFPLMAFQHWVLAIGSGLIFLILVYLAFGSHTRRREGKAEGQPEEREILFGQGEKNPMPPLLIFIYAGVIVFAIAYLILIGIRGSAF